jgi:hypothetical protein
VINIEEKVPVRNLLMDHHEKSNLFGKINIFCPYIFNVIGIISVDSLFERADAGHISTTISLSVPVSVGGHDK